MTNPTLLLIDDSAMMRRFVARFLSEKYQVTECASANEALELLGTGFSPDLVITDLDMPGITGMELIHNLSNSRPKTPLIVVSGAKDSHTRVEALRAGAGDFVTKPFHPSELELRIKKFL